MAIIPNQWCEKCAEDAEENDPPVPAEYELDSWGDGSGGGGFLCDNCATNMAEAAHERKLERFYGSSSPQSISELTESAYRERAELRRRD